MERFRTLKKRNRNENIDFRANELIPIQNKSKQSQTSWTNVKSKSVCVFIERFDHFKMRWKASTIQYAK